MKNIIITCFVISTLFISCEEIKKENQNLLGYWASYSIQEENLENIVYFGDNGLACFDVDSDNRSWFHKIPNVEELYCKDKLINYKVLDSKTLMLEDIKASFSMISNDEILISLQGDDFKLFRISKYQAIRDS